MMIGLLKRIDVVSLNVSDWQKAKIFYGETLGLPEAGFISDEVGWMEFGEKDGTHLAINHWRGPEPLPVGQAGATIVFAVEDAVEAVKELRSRGVTCDDVVTIPNMVSYASFYDPDGNRLQLASSNA